MAEHKDSGIRDKMLEFLTKLGDSSKYLDQVNSEIFVELVDKITEMSEENNEIIARNE